MSKVHWIAAAFGLAAALGAQEHLTTEVHALRVWDPDGAGPRGPLLVVGGGADRSTSPLADHVALYDPETGYWDDFGGGVDDVVRAICVLPNGHLVVGGDFERAGEVLAARVARWDGERWHAFGTGVDDRTWRPVRALAPGRGGALYAGGWFEFAGRVRATNVAVWRGKDWHELGLGVEDGVCALATMSNGDLVAAGDFSIAGADPAENIARWSGKKWRAFGRGTDGEVRAVLPLPGGQFVIAGSFRHAGGERVNYVARWDGERWRALDGGVDGAATSLVRLDNGDLVVSELAGKVWRWDGSTWFGYGELRRSINVLAAVPGDKLFAGGFGLHRWGGRGWVTVLRGDR